MNKLKKLKGILKKMGSGIVAYSGGVDSTFLLKVAQDILQDKVLAVTAVSPTYPKEERTNALKMAKILGVRHKIIKTNELKNKKFIDNPPNRCYFCKRELFNRLKTLAKINKLNFVMDGTNVSDKKDFRPGNRAKKELNVRSPLEEAGFTKEDIRRWSKKLGLNTWDKPQAACLASRVPYGIKISPSLLDRINKGEDFLRKLQFKQVRLRHNNGLCRLEVLKEDIPLVISKRNLIIEKLKRLGYNYITLDLEGYRPGSLNEVIKR